MDNNNFQAFGTAEPLTLIRPNPRSKALGLSGSTGKNNYKLISDLFKKLRDINNQIEYSILFDWLKEDFLGINAWVDWLKDLLKKCEPQENIIEKAKLKKLNRYKELSTSPLMNDQRYAKLHEKWKAELNNLKSELEII